MNEIVKTEIVKIPTISRDKIREYLQITGLPKKLELSDKEMLTFLEICTMFNLNPFRRDVHLTAYGKGTYRQFSVITGYEVYIRRAQESGLLKHWSAYTENHPDTGDLIGVVEIQRSDWSDKFVWKVNINEVIGKKKDGTVNKFWQTMPELMVKKCAISQGFRLCFPEVLGGMPYTAEEVGEDPQMKNITPTFDDASLDGLNEEKKKTQQKTRKYKMKQKEDTSPSPEQDVIELPKDDTPSNFDAISALGQSKFGLTFGNVLGEKTFAEVGQKEVQKYYTHFVKPEIFNKVANTEERKRDLETFLEQAQKWLNALEIANS